MMTLRAPGSTFLTSLRSSTDCASQLHLAGVALVEPFAEEGQLGKAVRGGHAAQVEPEGAGPLLDARRRERRCGRV